MLESLQDRREIHENELQNIAEKIVEIQNEEPVVTVLNDSNKIGVLLNEYIDVLEQKLSEVSEKYQVNGTIINKDEFQEEKREIVEKNENINNMANIISTMNREELDDFYNNRIKPLQEQSYTEDTLLDMQEDSLTLGEKGTSRVRVQNNNKVGNITSSILILCSTIATGIIIATLIIK